MDCTRAIVRASASAPVGDSHAVDTMNPEPLAPPNPAVASVFHAGRPCRRVGELGRSGYHGPRHICSVRNSRRAHVVSDRPDAIVRSSRGAAVGDSHAVDTMNPEQLAPPNPAGASLFHAGRPRRRVGEPGRWARPGHAVEAGDFVLRPGRSPSEGRSANLPPAWWWWKPTRS